MNIKSRILVSLLSIILLALAAVATVSTAFVSNVLTEHSLDYAHEVARTASGSVKANMDSGIGVARQLAQTFVALHQSGQRDRSVYGAITKNYLEEHPELLGVWTLWEPNALDANDAAYAGTTGHDATGRYIPYYYRADGKIGLDALVDYMTPGAGDYYLLARNSGKETVLEPYVYAVGGVDTLITSLVTPVIINGRVAGVTGVDISLGDIQTELAKTRPFSTGYLSLISTQGLVVADPNADFLGKTAEVAGITGEDLAAIKMGESFSDAALVGNDGSDIVRVSETFTIGATETPWSIVVTAPHDQVFAAITNMQIIVGITVVIIGVISAILVLLVGQRLSNPIIDLTRVMTGLAQNDLDVDIPSRDRSDEIGEMAAAVQIFKENAAEKTRLEAEQLAREKRAQEEKREAAIRLADDFEKAIGGIVSQVSSAATEMEASSETMASTADDAKAKSNAVTAASEQASANVETVASAAEELSSSIAEIGRQVAESSSISSNAVVQANETNERIQGLAEAAEKIGDVVAIITDIADQTNLLALNATIEAARAGESGKGFAVVASEVKTLANQTGKATSEISTQITAIQEATQGAVTSIQSIGKTISAVDEIATSIAGAVEEQGSATQEIARNVEEAATGTQQVSSNIGAVSQSTNETGAAASDMRAAAGELSRDSELLQEEIKKFLASVRAA